MNVLFGTYCVTDGIGRGRRVKKSEKWRDVICEPSLRGFAQTTFAIDGKDQWFRTIHSLFSDFCGKSVGGTRREEEKKGLKSLLKKASVICEQPL